MKINIKPTKRNGNRKIIIKNFARRRNINSISYGLMNSFISRNNDVYGYWGIGKLYSHINATNSTTIEIDLISLEIRPANSEFALLIKEYSNKMFKHLKKLNLNEDVIQKATMILNGYKNEPTLSLGQIAPNRINCKVSLVDDLNKKYTCETNTWCRKHNKLKESKRIIMLKLFNNSKDQSIEQLSLYLFGIADKAKELSRKNIWNLSNPELSYLIREKYFTDVAIQIAITKLKKEKLSLYQFNQNNKSIEQRELVRELILIDEIQWDMNPNLLIEFKTILAPQLFVVQIPDYIKQHFSSYRPKALVWDEEMLKMYNKNIIENTASHVHSAFETIRKLSRAIVDNTTVKYKTPKEEFEINEIESFIEKVVNPLKYSNELKKIIYKEKKIEN